jgi:hypothetical protein
MPVKPAQAICGPPEFYRAADSNSNSKHHPLGLSNSKRIDSAPGAPPFAATANSAATPLHVNSHRHNAAVALESDQSKE